MLENKGGQIYNVLLITLVGNANATPSKLQCQNIQRALLFFHEESIHDISRQYLK